MVKCMSMISSKSGRAVANQYIIDICNNIIFQSYTSTIAVLNKSTGKLTLGAHYDYSRTTTKYLHQFIARYCFGNTRYLIDSAPGNCFIVKIRWCIKMGYINYDEGMV